MKFVLDTTARLGPADGGTSMQITLKEAVDIVHDYELVYLIKLNVGETYKDVDGDTWTRTE